MQLLILENYPLMKATINYAFMKLVNCKISIQQCLYLADGLIKATY